MRGRVIASVLVVVLGAVQALEACGDKFLRVGRSTRYQRYAAIHPASILIYSPPAATPKGVAELAKLLARAGHKPQAIVRSASVRSTVAAGKFDLVIAAYADAARIERELDGLPARPRVLPVLDKPTPEMASEAARDYRHRLDVHAMTRVQALAEIDELMATSGRQVDVRP